MSKNSVSSPRSLVFVLLCLLGLVPSAWGVSNTVVISQVYGAGGNSGSTLNQDYVELFNAGATPVSLNGYSLQYRSATGTGAFALIAALPNVTMQPGTYLLFGASTPGTGTSINPDYTLNPVLNLAGAAGQVALSSSTTAVAAGCTLSGNSGIVDFVGYGTTSTCSEGLAPTANLTATTAAFRKNVCVDTDNNAADFNVAAAAPRSSSTTPTPCGATVNFAVSASASPSTVSIGSGTLLTARVTPGNLSSSIAVSVDLSAIGGSATQPLYDDGSHGDTTAGDNVFNFNATVGGSATGNVTLNFRATDAQLESATATAVLAIQAPVATVAIHSIQAGAPASAYLGQTVATTGIVVGVRSSGFYLEQADAQQDSDRSTSEGIFVVSGANASVVVGNELKVTGTVMLSSATALTPATELGGSVTFTVLSTGNVLPTPIVLKTTDDSPAGGLAQFLKFQGMRFTVPSFTTTSATGGTLTETTETVVSNGEFYGVVTGIARPFVETGISLTETTLPSGPTYCTSTVTTNCVPRFDANPELMRVESSPFGGTRLDVTANQTITNLLGVVDFTFNDAEFVLDPTAPGTLGTPMTFIPVPVTAANEFTVSSMNIERFYSNIPASGAVTITADAYARRLAKVSLLLRNVQRMPDIIGLQEVGTLATLNDISAKISTDAVAAGQPDPKYATCLVQGNDPSGINTAFLVKTTRVTVLDCTQFGKTTTFTNSVGAQATLNDRPPLVLHATVNPAGFVPFPVTVISNHLRSLNGVDDTSTTGQTVRLKREYQAEYLAALIQGYQANGERVVSVGDYNAFPFSDGYSDSLGVIKGTPPAPATVVNGTSSAYVAPSPVLTDLDTLITDQTQRYDYSYIGNVQVLDHIVVTAGLLPGVHIAYSHEDADFPLIQYNDATTPQSASDHDGAVAFFPLLVPALTATLTPTTQDFGTVTVGTSSAGLNFTLSNTGTSTITLTSTGVTGDFTRTTTCGATLAAASTCTVTVVFAPTATGARTGTLAVVTPNGTLTATLTGTGISPALDTLTPATQSFGAAALGTSSAVQVFTLANTGGTASTITSVTVTGDFVKTAATTCAASLSASSTCTISVVFTPTTIGARTGTLTVVATGGTGLVSTLTGTGAAQVTLTPATGSFSSTIMGKTSGATPFTVTNTSGAAIALAAGSVAVTGDFSQTNTCGTGLAVGGTCIVNVVFSPTAVGTRTGVLTVTPMVGGVSTPVTASLSGTGVVPPDFTFQATASSGTVASPITAFTSITLTSVGGYTGTLTFSCSGAPTNSTCTVSPSTVLLGSGSTTVSVTITSAAYKSAGSTSLLLGSVISLMALGVLFARRRGAVRIAGLMSLLLVISLYATGCGSSSVFSKAAAGTYTYNIVATDGTTSHTVPYTLTIQ